jgi:hypothetical protein
VSVLKELAGVGGVADGGRGVDAEHGRPVQRVRDTGQGFFEFPGDAQPVQGGAQFPLLIGAAYPGPPEMARGASQGPRTPA